MSADEFIIIDPPTMIDMPAVTDAPTNEERDWGATPHEMFVNILTEIAAEEAAAAYNPLKHDGMH